MSSLSISVLALARGEWQEARYRSISNGLDWSITMDATWEKARIDELEPDIILSLTDSYYETYRLVKHARAKRIPTLLMMDGSFEWRHTWENPRFTSVARVPYFQPTSFDKVACYGWQSVRTLESWGNIGKCELVGDPRHDKYLTIRRIPHSGRPRILVMSANSPGYISSQLELARRSFEDLDRILNTDFNVDVVWRLRKGLDTLLGVRGTASNSFGETLYEILPQMDAVISQPSTAALEAMLVGLPTAIVDYGNTPQYLGSAWRISACEHIKPVVEGLLGADAKYMVFQDEVLHNQLECLSPAKPRLIQLIERMVDYGRRARAENSELAYPVRILSPELNGHLPSSEHFQLQTLYPAISAFASEEVTALQIELANAYQELSMLRKELETRRVRYWFSIVARKLYRQLAARQKTLNSL